MFKGKMILFHCERSKQYFKVLGVSMHGNFANMKYIYLDEASAEIFLPSKCVLYGDGNQ